MREQTAGGRCLVNGGKAAVASCRKRIFSGSILEMQKYNLIRPIAALRASAADN